MKRLAALIVLVFAATALAGGKTPGPDTTHKNTKGKGHTQHQGYGWGHHKVDKPSKPDNGGDCGNGGNPNGGGGNGGNSSSNATASSSSNATGVGVGIGLGGSSVATGGRGGTAYGGDGGEGGSGYGGSATATAAGGTAVTGPVNAAGGSASVQGVQGGIATANAAAGQGGASNVNVQTGGAVWLGEVWRPNAFLTPWCPQPVPMEAVQPMYPAMPEPGDYPEVKFWYGGRWFVIE